MPLLTNNSEYLKYTLIDISILTQTVLIFLYCDGKAATNTSKIAGHFLLGADGQVRSGFNMLSSTWEYATFLLS